MVLETEDDLINNLPTEVFCPVCLAFLRFEYCVKDVHRPLLLHRRKSTVLALGPSLGDYSPSHRWDSEGTFSFLSWTWSTSPGHPRANHSAVCGNYFELKNINSTGLGCSQVYVPTPTCPHDPSSGFGGDHS